MRRYDLLRAATARLAAPASEQELYLNRLLLPLAIDGDSSAYGCDELGLQFEDCFISAEQMLAAGELSTEQIRSLSSLNATLERWSGEQHADFWQRDALQADPRWTEVRGLAQAALNLLPAKDERNGC
jgi:hypothetical protein